LAPQYGGVIGYLLIKCNVVGAFVVFRKRKVRKEESLMLSKRIILAAAGLSLCLCSFVSAQDSMFSLPGNTDYLTAANAKSRSAIVSSLPSDALQLETVANSDVANQEEAEEENAAHRADLLVLLGFGGILLAGFSLAVICLVTRKKRAAAAKKPVKLVGV